MEQNHREFSHRDLPPLGLVRDQCAKESFIKVEQKRKLTCRNRYGAVITGPNHLLRSTVNSFVVRVPTDHLHEGRILAVVGGVV